MKSMLSTLEDLKLFLAPYVEQQKNIDENYSPQGYEDYRNFILSNLEMPSFYHRKKLKPVQTISPLNDGFILTDDNTGVVVGSSNNIEELYDGAKHREVDVVFKGDFSNIAGVQTLGANDYSPSLTVPSERGHRLLISHTDTDAWYLDKNAYLSFLQTAEEYLEDPTDFLKAWSFVDTHPFSWRCTVTPDHVDWVPDYAVSKMWIVPNRGEDGEIVFMMETGAAYPDEDGSHTRSYHDLRLDVYAPSYEQGIIETAALIHKFFYLNGEERPDVDYEKSELELTLEERVAEIEELYED